MQFWTSEYRINMILLIIITLELGITIIIKSWQNKCSYKHVLLYVFLIIPLSIWYTFEMYLTKFLKIIKK